MFLGGKHLIVSFTFSSRKHVLSFGQIHWHQLICALSLKDRFLVRCDTSSIIVSINTSLFFSLLHGSLIVQSDPNWQWEYALHVQMIKRWHGAGERCSRGPWPYMLSFTCPCAAFTMCTPSKAPFHTQTPHSFPPHTPPGLYLHWCDPKWYACQRDTKCFSHLPSTPS